MPQHPHALLASRALAHCPAARASLLSCPGCTAIQSKGHARLPGAWATPRKHSTGRQHNKHCCLFRSCTTCCIFAACTRSNAVAGRRPSAMCRQWPLPPQAPLPRPPLISIAYTLYPNGYRPQGPALARCGRATPWLRVTRGASGRGGALAGGLLGIRVKSQWREGNPQMKIPRQSRKRPLSTHGPPCSESPAPGVKKPITDTTCGKRPVPGSCTALAL